MQFKSILLFLGATLCGFFALANENNSLSPTEIYERTQAVLQHFNIADDSNSQLFLQDLTGQQSFEQIKSLLPHMQAEDAFSKFVNLSENNLSAFHDYDVKQVPDFSIQLSAEPAQAGFHQRLLKARKNFAAKKLTGLRIALDPGHMGDPVWDERTGKYVKHRDGRKLSEGLMVLQTALLLEEKLKALGAEVLITHRTPGAVSTIALENLNIREYADAELKRNTLSDWFQNLLTLAPAGPELYEAFEKSAEFQSLYSEKSRNKYFILREDLQARADLINNFKPDIVLVLHMDAKGISDHDSDLEHYNKVKTFDIDDRCEFWFTVGDEQVLFNCAFEYFYEG